YNVNNRNYCIVLMSVRNNAPYSDRFEDNGTTIIYEGHDIQVNYVVDGRNPKDIDQPMTTPSGSLTENGKFFHMAQQYRQGMSIKNVKVYEKIKPGIWVYNGFFILTDAWLEQAGNRNVFKFKLEMLEDETISGEDSDPTVFELEHNRLIPTSVKVEVWQRDKGKCVKCGSNINLHYDHIIPFSKGGSSTTSANIQLLCAHCNLQKHDNIE
ncbi:MAG TPA: HNH endonuclease, partial [Candidatus Limiplasma sp.]|nr:HNH endonuclease [Candidatus Limiplasma sp.]